MGDRLVKVTDLKNDDTYKIRPLNEDAITRYMQIYENGKEKSIIIQKGTNRIIDGYHRVEACRRLDREKIKVKVVDLPDREIRSKSFKINNGHGVPLSLDERNQLITKLYTEDGKTQAQIAKITGLGQPRIAQILALLITNNTNNEDKRVKLEESDYPTIVRLILGGENQQQIAERFNVDQSRISQVWSNIRDSIHKEYTEGKQLKRDLAKNHDLTINEVDKILQGYEDPLNFDLQQNTLWPAFGLDDRFGQEHGSNLPALLIKNILALYTKPGDIILDPAAGGGVVRDAAEDMVNRKSYLFDLTPKRDEIRTHNLLTGPPKTPEPPNLVFLDLPYGPMLKGKYSEDPNDLANIPLEQFYESLEKIFSYWDQCKIVVLMSSWKKDGVVYDLPFETEKRLIETGWKIIDHIINGAGRVNSDSFYIENAKETRWLLRGHVHILVGEKP